VPELVVEANFESFRRVPDSTCFLEAFHKHELRSQKMKALLAKETTPLRLNIFKKSPHILSGMAILVSSLASIWKSE
jgi:hypothetical protein